jgi:hypothetical protein
LADLEMCLVGRPHQNIRRRFAIGETQQVINERRQKRGFEAGTEVEQSINQSINRIVCCATRTVLLQLPCVAIMNIHHRILDRTPSTSTLAVTITDTITQIPFTFSTSGLAISSTRNSTIQVCAAHLRNGFEHCAYLHRPLSMSLPATPCVLVYPRGPTTWTTGSEARSVLNVLESYSRALVPL